MDEHQLRIGKLDGEHRIIKLGFWKWLRLKLYSQVKLADFQKTSWKNSLPFYIVRCEQHGYFADYPHGYTNFMDGELSVWSEYFTCPRCRKATDNTRGGCWDECVKQAGV